MQNSHPAVAPVAVKDQGGGKGDGWVQGGQASEPATCRAKEQVHQRRVSAADGQSAPETCECGRRAEDYCAVKLVGVLQAGHPGICVQLETDAQQQDGCIGNCNIEVSNPKAILMQDPVSAYQHAGGGDHSRARGAWWHQGTSCIQTSLSLRLCSPHTRL